MASNGGPSKKSCIKQKRDDTKSFTPRDYQIEILEIAKEKNTIACLGTGTGKTFIAVMLIRENSNNVRIPFSEGGKRIFFLVTTVPLVNQQKKTIEDHTDLKVRGYYGEMEVDSWKIDDWKKEFIENEVLVMTAEIFRIILEHAFISPAQIQLLIFDECHRAQKDHPYRQAMKCLHNKNRNELPRIFGLSASLLNGKCKPIQLEKCLKELESTLLSTITTASDIIDLQRYGTDPDEFVVYYSDYKSSAADLIKEIRELSNKLKLEQEEKFEKSDFSIIDSDIVFFNKPLKCLNSLSETLSTLGPWCGYKSAEIYKREIETLLLRPFAPDYKHILDQIKEFLDYFMAMCLTLNGGSDEVHMDFLPDKLDRLVKIFSAAKKSTKFKNNDPPTIMDVTFEENPERYHKLTKEDIAKKNDTQICSIIFVQQRITAYVLNQWLLEIKDINPEISYLKPDFIVGHGSIGLTETSMNEKLQRKKVKAFRDNECNVLIATCVLEEGMDIRQCNLVVRFDLPGDFRSYVQSKGRARAKNSIYVLMVQQGEDNYTFLQDMCNFKTIEQLLLSKCRDRAMPTDEEISDNMADDAIRPYMPDGPDGPRITMSSAISLINRYCASLPSDMATKLVPLWTIKKSDPNNIATEYVCTLKMPINSSLRKPIDSEHMRKRRLAKMSAALKACEKLHEIGELNDHLIPISCLVDRALDDELGEDLEEEDGHGAQPGTNRRRQVYDKHVPIFLQNAKPMPDNFCFLHFINIKLIEPLPKELNPRGRPIIDPSDSMRGLGLLCASRLPPVNPFPLFTKLGKMLVDVTRHDEPIVLSKIEIDMVEEFHRFIFSDALWLKKGKEFLPNSARSSYYILPVTKNSLQKPEIDWGFIQMVKKNVYHEQKPDVSTKIRKYNENLYKDAVLLRTYKRQFWETERPTFHHVIKIMNDMSPKSLLKENKNFKDYYLEKYKVVINIDNQPLVETVQYAALHHWKPIYLSPKETYDENNTSKSKQKRKEYHEYLVPELSIFHPFPSSFFLKAMCLPTILFRLNGLLLAEEIRQSVAKEMLIGTLELRSNPWPPFHLETNDKELRKHLFKAGILDKENPAMPLIPQDIIKEDNYISSFEVKHELSNLCGPSPSLLLQAITTKSAGDEFDLERLEMIGDSFLKYVMSIKIYIKYINFDEGKLSLLRSRLIQNLNLYQKAKKKNLGCYLTNTCFSCNSTWLPPCYDIQEEVDEKAVIKISKNKSDKEKTENSDKNIQHHYFTKQIISDKSIADSVEALIGAYLLTSGQHGAIRFMAWLGLKPLPKEGNDFNNWPPPSPSPFVPDTVQPEQRLLGFIGGFDRFEKSINYTFKNKAYLLQAFTHQSYSYNDITDCYQRLEFLGDAVLDYLVTRQLYEDPNDHSPGKLTDLRSALVNNNYFASLAVVYRYHEFLKMLSPGLFKIIKDYVELLKESEPFKYFEIHKYYLAEIECFELEEVEVPKALGDVFESVAGAIFLDSGMSLDAVWKVYFPMIKPALDHLSKSVPVSPVKELHEMVPKVKFDQHFEQNGKTYIKVILPSGKTYQGIGPNKKVAKRSAAKRAVSDLKNKSQELMEVS